MRKLATIETVSEVLPIEGADSIEKIRVRDWWCVAKKGEFAQGDPCCFFEIDSLLPSTSPQFAFLAGRSHEVTIALDDGSTATGYRLRTVRMRGQISQGLALPVTAFGLNGFEVGEDVSSELGVHLWQIPISKSLMGFARGPFPSFIPKTDEERVQNLRSEIEMNAGRICSVTEKLDGTSCTAFWDEEDPPSFHVCSRNLDLKEGDNLYWRMAGAIRDKIPAGVAVQAEIIGEGVQGNSLRLVGQQMRAFNVYDWKTGYPLPNNEFFEFCAWRDIATVPLLDDKYGLGTDISAIIAMADGKSVINPQRAREGIVIRTNGLARLSFKAISNQYLLKSGI